MTDTFTEEDLELITDMSVGQTYNGYTVLAEDVISENRWSNTHRIVFATEGAQDAWAFTYDRPATEMQEGQELNITTPLPVKAVEKTVIVYE